MTIPDPLEIQMTEAMGKSIGIAGRILENKNTGPAAKGRARATIAALEQIFADLIDREMGKRDVIFTAVLHSNSIVLFERLRAVRSAPLTLAPKDWRSLLKASDPGRIKDLVERGIISADYGALVILRALIDGQTHLEPLLELLSTRDAEFPLHSTSFRDIIEGKVRVDLVAKFLRLQVQSFPEAYRQSASSCAHGGDPHHLVRLWLAGAEAPQPEQWHFESLHGLVEDMNSNHGRLRLMSLLGSLEAVLMDESLIEKVWRE